MSDKKIYGPDLYKRNEHGLLENAKYEFNEDGSVDWRAMIKSEFLYPNKGWFEARKKDVPTSPEGLDDKQLLIMSVLVKSYATVKFKRPLLPFGLLIICIPPPVYFEIPTPHKKTFFDKLNLLPLTDTKLFL